MDNRPIGVFDSGLGGLTGIKALRELLPGEDIIYFGDTKNVPYGTKDEETLMGFARENVAFLKSKGVKAILCACGTLSSVAEEVMDELEDDIPIITLNGPACYAAFAATNNGKIGIAATPTTIKNGKLVQRMRGLKYSLNVSTVPCEKLVPLIEAGNTGDDEAVKRAIDGYFSTFKYSCCDTVILGCTHYALIKDAVQEFMGPKVTLIDMAKEAAANLADILTRIDWLNEKNAGGKTEYFVSGDAEDFKEKVEKLTGIKLEASKI